MLYSIRKTEDSEKFGDLASLQHQVEKTQLQNKLGKQKFHEILKKVFEPATDTIKSTSEKIIKTMMLTSKGTNKVTEILNDKLSEIMNDRCKIASCLLSPLSKKTNPENTSQFKLKSIITQTGLSIC